MKLDWLQQEKKTDGPIPKYQTQEAWKSSQYGQMIGHWGAMMNVLVLLDQMQITVPSVKTLLMPFLVSLRR